MFLPQSDWALKQNNFSGVNRSKYELQEFLKPSLRIVPSKNTPTTCGSGKDSDSVSGSASVNKTVRSKHIMLL